MITNPFVLDIDVILPDVVIKLDCVGFLHERYGSGVLGISEKHI